MTAPGRLSVGLTGGLASGKSTVARLLRSAGFEVVDADELVRELHRPGGAGAAAVRELFGPALLGPDGGTDAAAVARRVFADPAARVGLEAALHPLVRERFAERARDAAGVAVLEATKLVEAGFASDFDLVVTVEADPELRIARAVARGLPESEARARLAAQADETTRAAAADVVLRNDGSRAELAAEVERLVERIRRLAAGSRE
jgi:dephospho-CoA kinase